eukprot:2851917-Prorocentrum_lima.AAC.1
MQPDTDTESDEDELNDDEEYQTLLSTAGNDPHALAEAGEHLCEAYFQAKRRGAASLDDVHADSASPTDAG